MDRPGEYHGKYNMPVSLTNTIHFLSRVQVISGAGGRGRDIKMKEGLLGVWKKERGRIESGKKEQERGQI